MSKKIKGYRLHLFLLLVLSGTPWAPSQAQSEFGKLIDPSTLFQINFPSYEQPVFKWNLEGKLQATFNEGLTELDDGNFPRAALLFKDVSDADSLFWPAWYYHGVSLKMTGEISAARTQLDRASQLQPDIPAIWLEYGKVCQALRDFGAARKALAKSVAIDNTFIKGYYAWGTLQIVEGDELKARRSFERCVELDPKSAEAYMGIAFLKMLKTKKAEDLDMKYLNQVIDADSSYQQGLFWRGLIYAQRKEFNDALVDLSNLVRYNPNNPIVLRLRSAVYLELGKVEDSFRDLRKSFLLEPQREVPETKVVLTNPVNHKRLSEYLVSKGYGLKEAAFFQLKKAFCLIEFNQPEPALDAAIKANILQGSSAGYYLQALIAPQTRVFGASSLFDKAIDLDPDFFEAYRMRSIHKVNTYRNLPGALEDTDEMLRIEPGSKVAFQLRAVILVEMKRFGEANEAFCKYMSDELVDSEAFKLRGQCRRQIGDFLGASQDLKRCVQLDPQRENYSALFQTQLAATDSLAALATLRIVVQNWPSDPDLHYALADLMVKIHLYDSAERVLDNATPLIRKMDLMFRPSMESRTHFLRSLIYAGKGNLEKGLKEANAALAIYSFDDASLFQRAKLLLRMDRTKLAIQDLQVLKGRGYQPAQALYDMYLK